MTEQEIQRINELARKARTPEGLTPAEKEEQATLRRAYVEAFRQSLRAQLDNTYVVDEQGNKTPLKRWDETHLVSHKPTEPPENTQ